ncbi:glycosyltransferase [Lacticaseibacillus pabuli]|uniref:Glycosyltransferase n=1 Tax=Lacticaseibacillus pabuli TaxID=3025672 RepID=A0ABY7WU65_9LACO|nr:glycosyltransferase [Lacticaseibacillus sp. KACC 23028]WDF83306.1 glycosyltransferase [Lacticaseibacillus sp. KACC 23028]
MANYYLHFNEDLEQSYPYWHIGALGKARLDHEHAARDIGFREIDAFVYDWETEPDEVLDARFDGIFAGLKRNDNVVVAWPILPTRPNRWVQKMIQHIHHFGAKLIFWFDDVETWRHPAQLPANATAADFEHYKNTDALAVEARFIALADGVILHSPQMRDRLAKQLAIAGLELPAAKSYVGPGGYFADYYQEPRQNHQGLDYSGSLYKAQFLLQLPNTVHVHAFGDVPPDFPEDKGDVVDFAGYVDPEAIVHMLKGSFGLVWDSETYPGVTGVLGDYVRYNTPTKVGQYLAANEPIIVWSQSALADFVVANHVGYAIDDLTQLPQIVNETSDETYAQLQGDVQRISPLIRSGFYFQDALFDVIRQVQDRWHPQYRN